jgi:pyridoxamine 5'-phosphate oxidase-like protein
MIESTNLGYDGSEPIPWSRALGQLEQLRPAVGSRGPTCWLSTIDTDGRPHVAGVAGCWLDGILYFVSGPGTRKARNIAADARCSFAISLPDLDLVLEGTASRVEDQATLSQVAARYTGRGWPLSVEGDVCHRTVLGADRSAAPVASTCLHAVFGSGCCYCIAQWRDAMALRQ